MTILTTKLYIPPVHSEFVARCLCARGQLTELREANRRFPL
jgi:hypothetical protein